MRMRMARKLAGSGRKPSRWASGENGRIAPTTAHASVAMSKGRLGRLRTKGTRRVRITKITSVCVARDSTNQPDRKRSGPACSSRGAQTSGKTYSVP